MENILLQQSFNYQINKLASLFNKAKKEKDIALFLFEKNARTPLFMLEAIFRVIRKIETNKTNEYWHAEFKFLEDVLGKIDYFTFFVAELKKNKIEDKRIILYFIEREKASLLELNTELSKSLWLSNTSKKINTLKNDAAAICSNIKSKDIAKAISKEIDKIAAFTNSEIEYSDVELSTHELRRKYRWFSIYCQSFRGLFQLRHHAKSRKKLEKYLTDETITSPFNTFPKNEFNTNSIYLKDNCFFALSWIIEELGKLKDRGLFVIALSKAIQDIEKISPKLAFDKACILLNENINCLSLILKETQKLVVEFDENKITTKIKKDITKYLKQK